MTTKIEAVRAALAAAEAAGVPHALLDAAAREVVALLEALAVGPDPRKLATYELAMRVQAAYDAGCTDRAALCERFGISKAHYYRLRRLSRLSRDNTTLQRGQAKQQETAT